MEMMDHEFYMARALSLAERGAGWANPNPMVGAVVVRDGEVVGEGWHTRFGQPHAEREALANCRARGNDPRGATLYVTLEPCCHTGKTPPCTEAVIEAGIARVVMGAPDPNPLVAGGGVAQLRAAGIEVVEGVLVRECRQINAAFFHYIKTKKPLVTLKYAMTLDGKIATRTGVSRWITGPSARKRVHEDRARSAAIMVGVGTILADDPQLTCRLQDFAVGDVPGANDSYFHENPPKNPLRIVCDSRLRTPASAAIVRTASETPTLIATAEADAEKHVPFIEQGCEVVVLPADGEGRVSLPALVSYLGERGIDSLIAEGGSSLAASALASGVVDRVQVYVAPKIFGGVAALAPIGGEGVAVPDEAHMFSAPRVSVLGDDVLLECDVVRKAEEGVR